MGLRSNSLTSHGLNEAICRRFADGQWHVIDEVVAACGHFIPPEIALRRLKTARADGRADPLAVRVEKGRALMVRAAVAVMGAEPGAPGTRSKWARFRLPPGVWGREYGTQRGSTKPLSKLTEEQVRSIRFRYALSGVTKRALAEEYGVHDSLISKIVTRKAWRHVA